MPYAAPGHPRSKKRPRNWRAPALAEVGDWIPLQKRWENEDMARRAAKLRGGSEADLITSFVNRQLRGQ